MTLLTTLDHLGQLISQEIGEPIVFGFFPKGIYHSRDTFTARVDLEGTTGVHAAGDTWSEALTNALNDREAKKAEMAHEAQFRAAFDASKQRRAA